MPILDLILALALFVGPAGVLIAPRLRAATSLPLLLAVLLSTVALLQAFGAPDSSLTVTHAFAAYDGNAIVPKAFVVDEVEAPAWQAPALALGWALLWLVLHAPLRDRTAQRPDPHLGPLLLAWGGSVWMIALQKTAGPAALALGLQLAAVPPFELVLWPALVASARALGRNMQRLVPMVLRLSIVIALAHLPLAIFGTLATRYELGTYLDVHTIDFIANPLNRIPTELEPGSNHQLAWLIWGPQLVMWPAFTMLSAGGIGFFSFMHRKHVETQR